MFQSSTVNLWVYSLNSVTVITLFPSLIAQDTVTLQVLFFCLFNFIFLSLIFFLTSLRSNCPFFVTSLPK